MNKYGFTLVELLTVIIIIALISGIATIAYTNLLDYSNPLFYRSLEENIELATNDYLMDHRDITPIGNDTAEINLGDLEEAKYVEKVIDVDGNKCTGKIVVYRENNRNRYDVCLTCGKYKSTGPHCQ